MSERFSSLVRIDHAEAGVVLLGETEGSDFVIQSYRLVQRQTENHGENPDQRAVVDSQFFLRIVGPLNHIGHALLTGPGNAKYELKRYIDRNHPDLVAQVSPARTPDRINDAALLVLEGRMPYERSRWSATRAVVANI
jgi:stalled ribosome rescue protein Dom34